MSGDFVWVLPDEMDGGFAVIIYLRTELFFSLQDHPEFGQLKAVGTNGKRERTDDWDYGTNSISARVFPAFRPTHSSSSLSHGYKVIGCAAASPILHYHLSIYQSNNGILVLLRLDRICLVGKKIY